VAHETVVFALIIADKGLLQVYGLRFAIGFFQGIAFPGFAAVLGAWYTPSELGKRMALYEVSARVAGMFSGYIQAGLYSHMDGTGMASWRYVLIYARALGRTLTEADGCLSLMG